MILHLDEHISPLKEGEKIKVKLNLNKKTTSTDAMTSSSSTDTSSTKAKPVFGLKPPPPAGSTVFASVPDVNAKAVTSNEDEDWGDFTSS